MLGTVVNAVSIIIGGLAGLILKGGIKERMNQTIIQGVGLCVIFIGLGGAMKGLDFTVEIIFFIVIGSFLGESINIEGRLESIGNTLEKRFSRKDSTFSRGFVTASLLYCVGAMAVMGSLESGLENNHDILYAKSVLDGIISVVLASTLGIGVVFSAVSVFVYQGSITLLAGVLTHVLNETVVIQMSATGGLLITGLGFSMASNHRLRVGNMLPSVFMPALYYYIRLFLNI